MNEDDDEPLAELCTQAALAGPIGEIWSGQEEDEAWAHLEKCEDLDCAE